MSARAQPQPVTFAQPTEFTLGVRLPDLGNAAPVPSVTGDFNHDGYDDVAVLTATGIAVVLGGPLGFRAPAQYSAGGSAISLAAADFNSDGNLDLVIVLQRTFTASLLFGKGDGSFTAPVPLALPSSTVYVAVGDFNGDGFPDLAFASEGQSNVFTALGKGDGSFSAFAATRVPHPPVYLATGDFNDDGKQDLYVVGEYVITYNSYYSFAILTSNGSGTFNASPVRNCGINAIFADLLGDGNLDALSVNQGVLDVYPGNGKGQFGPPYGYPLETIFGSYSPATLTLADLNGDGILDAVTANFDGSVSTLFGNGNGTFQAAKNYAANFGPSWVVVGRYFGSDTADLAVVNAAGKDGVDGALSLIRNKENGIFAAQGDSIALFGGAGNVGDFNGDGKIDIVLATSYPTVNGGDVEVFAGLGDGRFGPVIADVTVSTGNAPGVPVAADFNHDGLLDFAVPVGDLVVVGLQQPDHTFQLVTTAVPAASQVEIAWVGHLNNDGNPDLIVTQPGNGAPGATYVLLGNGNGTFQPAILLSSVLIPGAFTVGDFNGDGKLDIVTVDPSIGTPNPAILFGNGDGTFQPPAGLGVHLLGYALAAGDFNGDGNLDLAIAGPPLVILLGRGNGTFRELPPTTLDNIPAQMLVADLNRDGNLDILANITGGDNLLNIYLGNGDGTFTEQPGILNCVIYNGTCSPFIVDLNGDGRPDILNIGYGIISALINITAK